MPEEMPRGPLCGAREAGEGTGKTKESQESDDSQEENGNVKDKELCTLRGNCGDDAVGGGGGRIGGHGRVQRRVGGNCRVNYQCNVKVERQRRTTSVI